jgi:hypothetical protein
MTDKISFIIVTCDWKQLYKYAFKWEIWKYSEAILYYREPDYNKTLINLIPKHIRYWTIVDVYEIFDVI